MKTLFTLLFVLLISSAAHCFTELKNGLNTTGTVTANLFSGDGSGITNINKIFFKYKTATESVSSSTSLQDDDDLFFTMNANEIYWFEAQINPTSASGTPDLLFAFSATGATVNYQVVENSTGAAETAAQSNFCKNAATYHAVIAANQANKGVKVFGQVFNGGSSTTLKFRWAQNSSNATATSVLPFSNLRYGRVQ